MKTKISQAITAGIVLLFLIFNFGCNKSSTTSPSDIEISGSGSDYFPLNGDQTTSWTAAYQMTVYDSTGKPLATQSVSNQSVKSYIGTATTVGGTQAYPIYGYNQNGTGMSSSGSFVAQKNQAIVLFQSTGDEITLLPAQLQVGAKWVANPSSDERNQVTLEIAGGKSSYTNSAGKTYSNVLQVDFSFFDSATTNYHNSYGYGTEWYSYDETQFIQLDAKASIYFAKGVGIVDFKLNQAEVVQKWSDLDSSSYQNYWNGQTYVDTLIVTTSSGYGRVTGSASMGMMESHQGASVAQRSVQNSLGKTSAHRTKDLKRSLIEFLFGNHEPLHDYAKH